jgi:hypothetical protein
MLENEKNIEQIDKKYFQELIKKLENVFKKYCENITNYCILNQFSRIMNNNNNNNQHQCQIALNETLNICLKNEQIKHVIIEHQGILLLFKALNDPNNQLIMDIILRTLSILCSHPDSLKYLQRVNCYNILTDILCDENASEWTRTEAGGCIAQITSPQLDFSDHLNGFVENIQDLIRALTSNLTKQKNFLKKF